MITREQLVAAARTRLETRFQHQGRSRIGYDCYGLLLDVAIDCGIKGAIEVAANPDYQGYGHSPNPKTMHSGLVKNMVRVPVTSALPADVLWMKFDNEPRHFALVSSLDPMMIIHAYAQARKVTESAVNVWGGVVVSAWRFKEFA